MEERSVLTMLQNLLEMVVIVVVTMEAVAEEEEVVVTKMAVEAVVVVDDLVVAIEVDMEAVTVEEVPMVAVTVAGITKVQVTVDRVVATMAVKEVVVMVAAKAGVAMEVKVNITKAVVGIILNNPQDNMDPNLLELMVNPQVDKAMVVHHLQEVKVSNIVVVVIASQLHQPVMALALMDSKQHQLLLQVTIRAMAKVLEAMVVVLRLPQEDIHRVPVMVAQRELVMEEAVVELAVMLSRTG